MAGVLCGARLCGADLGHGFKLISYGISVQHPNLEEYKGVKCENADACYVDDILVSVADGVSGVLKHGIDPSLLSHELLDHVRVHARSYIRHPQAFEEDLQMKFDQEGVPSFFDDEIVNASQCVLLKAGLQCENHGACTALVCMLDETRTSLHTISVGDSGMLVLRRKAIAVFGAPYHVVFKSTPKQHSHSTPVQFHRMPPELPKDADLLRFLSNAYDDLDITEFDLLAGDIIVGGSDGLFDNLFESEICEIVSELCDGDDLPNGSPDVPVAAVCQAIHQASVDAASPENTEATPFSEKLSQDENRKIVGGHPDDMTVVCAFVVHAGPDFS